jgi:hypothetical protein
LKSRITARGLSLREYYRRSRFVVWLRITDVLLGTTWYLKWREYEIEQRASWIVVTPPGGNPTLALKTDSSSVSVSGFNSGDGQGPFSPQLGGTLANDQIKQPVITQTSR